MTVFAQEASSSASDIATPSANSGISVTTSSAQVTPEPTQQATVNNPFSEADTSSGQNVSGSSLSTLLISSLTSTHDQGSAGIKQKSVIHSLLKKTFKHDESIDVTVGNATADEVQVRVVDPKGKDVDPGIIDKTTVDTQTTISIKPFSFGFRPGKYTIYITNADGTNSTQDFTWGVLALNTNKSLYVSNETAKIAIAVLDEQGNMVCNANVKLEIKNQISKIDDTLSMDNGKIIVNPQCQSHAFSLTPDYEASFELQGVGNYDMTLTATTKNGSYSIDDAMHVVQSVPFDVERTTATRIFPGNTYPVLFHITANQDFNGTVTEYAPANFDITPYATESGQLNATGSGAKSYDSSQLVTLPVDIQQQFGTSSLNMNKPFDGNFILTQGFGAALTDPRERELYRAFGLAGHDGLDFALPSRTVVLSADAGIVSLSGDGVYGTTIVIDHPWGRSYYGHLSKTEVSVGQQVIKGQEIGLSGNTGLSTGAHLHFGIKPLHPDMANGFYGKVDPTPYLSLSNVNSNQAVLGVSTSTIDGSAMKVIRWNNVMMKKGDIIDLGYGFKAPPLSPQFYTLGPLTFTQQDKTTVFQEARQWQLAIDANSTAGPNNCGTSVDDSSIGTIAWTNPGNACTSGQNTSSSLSHSQSTHYLKVTNFGFTSGQIPTGSKIVGIQFTVTKLVQAGSGPVFDNAVRDVKGGTIDSGNDHSSGTVWQSTATAITYGTTSDLWGQTWAASDITSSNFGMAISAKAITTITLYKPQINAFVTATITFDGPPNAPSQDAPTNNATGVSITPVFNMTATDPETDNLQYKVTIYSNSPCTTVVQTNDETSSQTGWSGQNVSGTSYTSGTQGVFTTQSALTASTQYWWKASAIDPSGSNTFTNSATCNTFTTASSGPTLDQLMRYGDWFSNGVKQPFTF